MEDIQILPMGGTVIGESNIPAANAEVSCEQKSYVRHSNLYTI